MQQAAQQAADGTDNEMPPNVRIKHVVTRSYSPRRGWRERTSLTINTDLREGADDGSEEEKEEE